MESTPSLQAVYLNKKLNSFSKSWKSVSISNSSSPCSSYSSISSSSFSRSRSSSTFSTLSDLDDQTHNPDCSDESIPLFDDIPLLNPEYYQSEHSQINTTSCVSSLISNSLASTHEEILNDDHPLSNLSNESLSTTTITTPISNIKKSKKSSSKISTIVSKLSSFLSSTSQKLESNFNYDFYHYQQSPIKIQNSTNSIEDNIEIDEMVEIDTPDSSTEYEKLRQKVCSMPDTCFTNRNSSRQCSPFFQRHLRMDNDQLRQIALYQSCCDLNLLPSDINPYEIDIYDDYINNQHEFDYLYQEDSYTYEYDDSSDSSNEDEGTSVDFWCNSIINHIKTDQQYVEDLRITKACYEKYNNPKWYINGIRIKEDRKDPLPQTVRHYKNLELIEAEQQFINGFHTNVNEKALFSLDDFKKQNQLNKFKCNLNKALNLKNYNSLPDNVQFVSKKSQSIPSRFSNVVYAQTT